MSTDILHQHAKITPLFPPQTASTGTITTSYLDMGGFEKVRFFVYAGTVSTGETIDFKVLQATAAAGTGAKDVTGGSITQMVDADDYKMACIDVHAQALDIDSSNFNHVAAQVVLSGTVEIAVWAEQYNPRTGTVTQAATFSQQVTVY